MTYRWQHESVAEAALSFRVQNALQNAGYETMGDVATAIADGSFDSSAIPNFGNVSAAELQEWLEYHEARYGNAIETKGKVQMAITASCDDGLEAVTFKQSRGPTVRFTGRLLCETSWVTKGHQPLKMMLEVWETRGGALVAASILAKPDGEEGFEDVRVAVVEPIYGFAPHDSFVEEVDEFGMKIVRCIRADLSNPKADEAAMRFAVMDHFDWEDRARSMVRKIGWNLTREIE